MNLDTLCVEEGQCEGQRTFAQIVRDSYELADNLRASGNAMLAQEIEDETDADVREWMSVNQVAV